MRKSWIVVAVAALSGCAYYAPGGKLPLPETPQVRVANGKLIVVDQEPIAVPRGKRDFRITWQLPRGLQYRFPREGGIVVAESRDQIYGCQREDEFSYFCVDRNTAPGRFKYTITVLDAANGDKPLAPLDPWIVNDE